MRIEVKFTVDTNDKQALNALLRLLQVESVEVRGSVVTQPATPKVEPKAEPPKAEPPKAEPEVVVEPEVVPEPAAVTADDMKNLVMRIAASDPTALSEIKKILLGYGVAKVTDIPAEKIAEAYQKFQALEA